MISEHLDVPQVLPHPAAPLSLEETGLSLDLLLQLTLKHMHFAGELTGSELARRLGLRFTAIEPAVHALKSQHQIEIIGGTMVGPASYRYRITDSGRTRVTIFLEHNQYVGRRAGAAGALCRVPARLEGGGAAHARRATACAMRFSTSSLGQRVLDQLGPAINAGHSLFVYGPPGNGKSVISQAIRNLLDGDIAIPHALEVEGQIVRLFDPVNHDALPLPEGDGLADEAAAGSAVDALPASAGDGRRRADARFAGVELQPDVRASTTRRCRLRRTAASWSSTTSAASRSSRGSSSTAGSCRSRAAWTISRCRPGRNSSCRSPCCSSSRRTCGPPRSWTRRSSGGFTTRCSPRARRSRNSATIFEGCCLQSRRALRPRARQTSCSSDFYRPRRHPAARLPSARPDRSGALAGRVPGRAAAADAPSSCRPRARATSWKTRSPRRCYA